MLLSSLSYFPLLSKHCPCLNIAILRILLSPQYFVAQILRGSKNCILLHCVKSRVLLFPAFYILALILLAIVKLLDVQQYLRSYALQITYFLFFAYALRTGIFSILPCSACSKFSFGPDIGCIMFSNS